ncbi:MAG: glycosyltransferase family 4 protein [Actinomycetota bacterium]
MTSLVFVTQLIDPEDPALGFVCGWISALAEKLDRVDVVANEVRCVPNFPGDVVIHSLGKERGIGRIGRGLRFQRTLASLFAERKPVAVLAHMCPDYLTLGAPLAKAYGVRSMLWFAHPANSWRLATAERLADRVLTSLPGSYPRASQKVRVIGQAIDTRRLDFRPAELNSGAPRIVAMGRTSRSKGFDTIIRGVALLRRRGIAATLKIIGPSTTEAERRHRDVLAKLTADLGLVGTVTVTDGVPPHRVPTEIRGADVLANAMVAGSGDKVVFEALALGLPVVVSNPAFGDLVDGVGPRFRFRPDDPEDLADCLSSLTQTEMGDALRVLRSRVERQHSLDHWADAVLEAAG